MFVYDAFVKMNSLIRELKYSDNLRYTTGKTF